MEGEREEGRYYLFIMSLEYYFLTKPLTRPVSIAQLIIIWRFRKINSAYGKFMVNIQI